MQKVFFLTLIVILCCAGGAFALDTVEVLTGYATADILDKGEYQLIPFMVSFDFDAKPFFAKYNFTPPGRLDFIVEPFANTVIDPDPNVEIGINLMLKYMHPLTARLQPFIKLGAGPAYMTQHTREQATQFNFVSQAGGGLAFFLDDTTALTCEYRRRHLSNNGCKKPNKGINSNMVLAGVSFFFD